MDISIYKKLEDNNIFIYYNYEHYQNGTNCLFQIEFKDKNFKTMTYGDNHEFGNVSETMLFSIDLAFWYLENIDYICVSKNGYSDKRYFKYKDELLDFINKYKKQCG
jgi:hypothetical protein